MALPSPLPLSWYQRDSKTVARELLGCQLIKKQGNKTTIHTISEVEVYDGFEDTASHASKGKTKRTEVMYGPAGHWYVYLIYGMYHMINIVTREAGYPAAILIRGTKEVSGPGRLARALGIDKSVNTLASDKKTQFWIAAPVQAVRAKDIVQTPRIGIGYAKPACQARKWRFTLAC